MSRTREATSHAARGGVLALVDDDDGLRQALSFAFETHGFAVASFSDAESALAAPNIRVWRCAVLDQRLPGMSGLDLLARLRGMRVAAPALLITSNPDVALRARAASAGVDIVEKPLLDGSLIERVRQLWR